MKLVLLGKVFESQGQGLGLGNKEVEKCPLELSALSHSILETEKETTERV